MSSAPSPKNIADGPPTPITAPPEHTPTTSTAGYYISLLLPTNPEPPWFDEKEIAEIKELIGIAEEKYLTKEIFEKDYKKATSTPDTQIQNFDLFLRYQTLKLKKLKYLCQQGKTTPGQQGKTTPEYLDIEEQKFKLEQDYIRESEKYLNAAKVASSLLPHDRFVLSMKELASLETKISEFKSKLQELGTDTDSDTTLQALKETFSEWGELGGEILFKDPIVQFYGLHDSLETTFREKFEEVTKSIEQFTEISRIKNEKGKLETTLTSYQATQNEIQYKLTTLHSQKPINTPEIERLTLKDKELNRKISETNQKISKINDALLSTY